MPRPEVLAILLFRQEPGDLGIQNAPAFGPIEDAKLGTQQRLRAFFDDKTRLGRKKPTMARLVNAETGEILAEYRMTPTGVEEIGSPTNA